MSNREKGGFPSQLEVSRIGGSSSSFDPHDIQKVNAVISLRLGKKFDTHVGEQNENDSPSPSATLPPAQSGDVFPSPLIQIPSNDGDGCKQGESIYDSTYPKDFPTPCPCVIKPSPPFPNLLKGKKVQSHVDKIRKTFSQVKTNIPLLDVIQQMPHMLAFLKTCGPLKEPLLSPREHFWPLM